jgi:hypothetical protein
MKIIANYTPTSEPPKLTLVIHDAPHRRMHVKVIEQYRMALRAALAKIGIVGVIEHQIEVWVLFINPSSPDLGNLYLALEQAMDDATLTKLGDRRSSRREITMEVRSRRGSVAVSKTEGAFGHGVRIYPASAISRQIGCTSTTRPSTSGAQFIAG